MTSTFTCFRDLDVPVVDADAHVNEPPDLWQDRVPAKWRDRAPKVIDCDGGDCWSFENGDWLRPLGLNATAGLSVAQFRCEGVRYADMRPGAFDPKARLADLDVDGIHAQVLYPSIALEGARVYGKERELQLACARAYNEWIAEFCAESEGRLAGLGIIPTAGVDDAMAEVEAAVSLGLRGFILSRFPNGSFDPDPDDDRFWTLVADTGLPVAVHLGSFVRPKVTSYPDMREPSFMALAGLSKGGARAIEMASMLLFSGVFERVPDLRMVLVESGIGWIPSMLEQLDTMFLRYRFATDAVTRMQTLPSELFHRNVWATFITDRVGLENLHRLNSTQVMWSSDYPHDTCDWPNSRATIEHQFRGVPIDNARAILHGNAVSLYRLAFSASRGSKTSESPSTV
ncbi:MAG: amidohydrolase family protein [Acidimicrobiia bacterium]